MAWIESHENLPSHPKTKRLCRTLKIDPITAVGHLHFLWWWAMNHAQDGILDKYSSDDIADACDWKEDEEVFFQALVTAKFIDKTQTGHVIHDWHDYAGKLIAIRQKDAERKRTSRGKEVKSNGHPEDIQRTSEGQRTESICDLNQDLDLNKEIKTSSSIGDPYQVFLSSGFGQISPIIKDFIDDLIEQYTEFWVCQAMREAVLQSKKTISYVEGILKRWKATGIDEPWTQEKPRTQNNSKFSNSSKAKVKIPMFKAEQKDEPLSAEEKEEIKRTMRELGKTNSVGA